MKATVMARDGKTKYEVEAWATDVPGLLITKIYEDEFTVTHVASGHRVGGFNGSKEQAFIEASKLGMLDIDWTQDMHAVKVQVKQQELIDIIGEIVGAKVQL